VRTIDRPLGSFKRDPMQIARISSFLVLETPDATAMRMEISRLELLTGDTWLPLLSEPQVFDSIELGSGQLFVGAQNMPPGDYRRLRLEVAKAEVLDTDGSYVEVLTEPRWFEIDLTGTQTLVADDSKTLLLLWDVDGSLDARNRFQPALIARLAMQQIYSDLVLVSCPEIDTVFILRADNNRVVASFGLKGAPTYMAIDPDTASRRLFVLCSRDRMIKIIDLETYRVVEFFAVPLSDEPRDMTLSPDGRSLYLLDEQSGYLTRMDTDTGQILARSFLDFRPGYLHYLPEQNLLAVSLTFSQKVLLLDPLDLKVAEDFPTGSSPAGMLDVDSQLYIAERGDNNVRVIDLAGRNEQNRLAVGFGPRRLISTGQQIYVANTLDGSLSVLEIGGFGVVQRISGIGRPGEMALNSFYRRIYVADEEQDALSVVDANSNRIISRIELGAMPFGLAVIQ
jgi:YVTN family beta-propeller protein